MPKDPNEIGALWKADDGKPYVFSGEVNGEKVVVFRNTFKKPGERTPDYRILKRQQREQGPTYKGDSKPGDKITDDDIPF